MSDPGFPCLSGGISEGFSRKHCDRLELSYFMIRNEEFKGKAKEKYEPEGIPSQASCFNLS